MSGDFLLFTLLYILLAVGIVYPPKEYVSAGFTLSAIFAGYLGSENENFIQYHLRRTMLNVFAHSLLPLGYVLMPMAFYDNEQIAVIWFTQYPYFIELFTFIAFILPLVALYKLYIWTSSNWEEHPICKNLKKFCNSNTIWLGLASDINIEYRRIDKLCIETNTIIRIIATDNWILKVTPYTIYCTHQSDSALIVKSSDTHNVSLHNWGEVQYINVEVKSTRAGVAPFSIRLNALDFKDLQDKCARPITILPNVKFHKTIIERFIDAFCEQVSLNETYETNQELESCIGCMQATANVKLQKLCSELNSAVERENACSSCYCRPMWCMDCMARWFASRQDSSMPDTWLASKCTCPMCRATFCMFDISFVRTQS